MSIINLFYNEAIRKNSPHVSIYEYGDIPNAILTKKRVYILKVPVLPDMKKDSFENFEHKSQYWFNDQEKVGNMR